MTSDAWRAIEDRDLKPLDALFREDTDRLERLTLEAAGLYFEWSKTHLDQQLLEAFHNLAEAQGFRERREALFAGEVVNPTEGRAATHVAERGSGAPGDVELADSRRRRMRALCDAAEAGAFGPITGVLHIGIGGSLLGPALLVDALGRRAVRSDVRFVSNIDPEAMAAATERLDPATTLVVVVSKTFTTAETLANMQAAIDWLRSAAVPDPYGRLVAVTAAPEAAVSAGIDETRVLPFGEGVGGRYSLWSAVSVTVALALGWGRFEELLEGGAEMDRHFRYAEPAANAPLLAAYADQLYVQKAGAQTRAIFAYADRLRLLPFYLQQLEMESNGKSVGLDGSPMSRGTAPITWGGTGTDVQHAVFQLLHQGKVIVPAEFVLVAEADHGVDPEAHRQLVLNALAQGAALMAGRTSAEPERNYPGNRPSSTILLDRLDARRLGALIAFYEHRTFANAALLGINPFDQFGVELGKEMARAMSEGVEGEDLDPSTRSLIERTGV